MKHAFFLLLAVLVARVAEAAPAELNDPPSIAPSTEVPVVEMRRPVQRAKPKRRRRRRAAGVPPRRPSVPTSEQPVKEEPPEPAPPEVVEEAAPEEVAPEKPRLVTFEFHGFAMARATATWIDEDAAFFGVFPTPDSPRAFFEVNIRPSLRVAGPRFHLAADLTAYVGSTTPKYLFIANELYAESRAVGPLYLLAGRRRVIWGSGLAANPTDLINPVKNPLDFEQQRAGAFLFPLVEVVTKWVTFSALLNPHTRYNEHALPVELDFTRPLVAARFYFLLKGVDVNLMYFYDHAREKHFGGLSLARYFGDKFEAHVEALVGQGPSEQPFVPIVPGCGVPPPAFQRATGSLIAGGRVDLADQTFVSAEYFWNGNGFTGDAYDQYRTSTPCIRAALAAMPPTDLAVPGHPIDPFFTLMRQHYLAVTFLRPHLTADKLENLSISASALWSPQDLSLILQTRVAYKLFEQGTLGLIAATWVGPRTSEFFSNPTRVVGQVDLKVTF